jgi:hypothetical protein
VNLDATVLSTQEEIQKKIISLYLKETGETETPQVVSMTVQGSYKFYTGKTLEDYQVLPGIKTIVWVDFV